MLAVKAGAQVHSLCAGRKKRIERACGLHACGGHHPALCVFFNQHGLLGVQVALLLSVAVRPGLLTDDKQGGR